MNRELFIHKLDEIRRAANALGDSAFIKLIKVVVVISDFADTLNLQFPCVAHPVGQRAAEEQHLVADLRVNLNPVARFLGGANNGFKAAISIHLEITPIVIARGLDAEFTKQTVEGLAQHQRYITHAAGELVALRAIEEGHAVEPVLAVLAQCVRVTLPAQVVVQTWMQHARRNSEVIGHRLHFHQRVIGLGAILRAVLKGRRCFQLLAHFFKRGVVFVPGLLEWGSCSSSI